MNNTQTITQQDVDVIKAHKEQYLKPLQRLHLLALAKSDWSNQELLQNQEYQQAIAELREIGGQGYKRQIKLFANMVYGGDYF